MTRIFSPDDRKRSHDAMRRRLDEAFWSKTKRVGECLEWTGNRQTPNRYGGGYGTILRFGRTVYAHRRAYELSHGPIPAGLEVLHTCDNPPCIEPAHLRVGTHADNMRDAAAKGRTSKAIGQSRPQAKITPDDVRAIRSAPYSRGDSLALATQYGIRPEQVRAILRRESWRDVL